MTCLAEAVGGVSPSFARAGQLSQPQIIQFTSIYVLQILCMISVKLKFIIGPPSFQHLLLVISLLKFNFYVASPSR